MTMQTSGHVDAFTRERLPAPADWPDFRFDLPELAYPDRLNCAAELLDRNIENGLGDKIAIYSAARDISWSGLRAEASRIAHVLVTDMGLVPGNRVLLHGYNSIELIAAWYGVLLAGGVAVMTMPLLRAGELVKVIAKARVSHALCDATLASAVREAVTLEPVLDRMLCWGPEGDLAARMAGKPGHFDAADTARDDIALLAFTSGTTGDPKACAHFHSSVLAMADTFGRSILAPEPDEIYLGTPPFAFTFGLGACVVFPARAGLAIALPDRPGFEPLCETVQRYGVTTLFTAPTGYRALMGLWGDYDLSSLRKGISAGEHLPAATSEAFFELSGIRLIDGIGATEMIHIFISAAGADIRPGATGKAVPGYQARIVDDHGEPVPDGEIGRLAVKGPTGCLYLDDARQKTYVQNGWNITGDLYQRDAEGYFWYVSRADDLIVSSGYNIAGPEVEQALLLHETVLECAVVGAADEERGTIVKAFIVLAESHEGHADLVKALQDHVKACIAPYKYPRAIEFVAALPKTQTGKIQRFKLR
ncbi:AMP-binding protein [Maricaulis sp.]|uniref:AMP-binding protein n=1 Tax=Maricaulis sp. TaxID=1486257 RepID=UPI003A9337E5